MASICPSSLDTLSVLGACVPDKVHMLQILNQGVLISWKQIVVVELSLFRAEPGLLFL